MEYRVRGILFWKEFASRDDPKPIKPHSATAPTIPQGSGNMKENDIRRSAPSYGMEALSFKDDPVFQHLR